MPQEKAEAVRWFRKAAKQGNLKAQRALRVSLSAPMKVLIGIDFLGILFLSLAAYGEARKGFGTLQRGAIVRELLAVMYLMLVFLSLFHVGVAYTIVFRVTHLLRGIVVAMLIPILRPKSEKFVLKLSLILFIGFNLYATTRFSLRYPAAHLYLFYSANAFLIGMAIPSAAALRLAARKEEHDLNSHLRPHSMQSR